MLQSLKNIYHFLVAIWANLVCGFPSRKLVLIGVTGTDGKTTTVHLIYEILKTAGKRVAMVSSVAARMGEEIDTGFHVTTPNSFRLQQLLKRMVDEGYAYAVLEVTSHGLDQHRLLGCHFKVGVITNISHEHLDYHKTYARYLAAKAKLFEQAEIAVLNADDRFFRQLEEKIPDWVKMVTYGKTKGNVRLTRGIKEALSEKLSEPYNEYNALAALAVTQVLNLEKKDILTALNNFQGVTGRMEKATQGEEIIVFIDFAHTPNALKEALTALRSKRKNPSQRIIAVFGAAGLRDQGKRLLMGKVATSLADEVVLTAEDPRTEDVGKIIEQIASGAKTERFHKIPDRKLAIEYAIIELAKKGDIVAVFGKGHERSMCFGKTEYPWSDHQAVQQALAKRRRRQ